MRVAVVGASGQLGSALVQVLEGAQLQTVSLGHERVEVTRAANVTAVLEQEHPDVVVNTAAFHKVEECEREPGRAFEVNALGALNVARACQALGARCVYVSTDYVFDGTKSEPYTEEDTPKPVNVYGASKLAGEHLVLQTCPDALVVRVASLFGGRGARGKGTNFVLTMLDRAHRGEPLRVVNDIRMSPTYTLDAAEAILQLIERGVVGVFHVVNEGRCTWYEFARKIVEISGLEVPVEPVSHGAFPARARRPVNSSLATERLAGLGIRLRPWTDALGDYLAWLAAPSASS